MISVLTKVAFHLHSLLTFFCFTFECIQTAPPSLPCRGNSFLPMTKASSVLSKAYIIDGPIRYVKFAL